MNAVLLYYIVMRLLPVKIDGKFGYIDTKGEVAIEPRFRTVDEFYEGRARVQLGEDKVVIDEKGDVVFTPPFPLIGVFEGGRCIMAEDGKHGYVDDSGNVVIPPRYHQAYSFHNGYAVVRLTETSPARLIDLDGRVVMEDYGLDYKSEYGDGLINLAAARNDRICAGFVDLDRNWVIEPDYMSVFPFREGLAAVRHMRTGLFGFIDRNNMFRIEAKYDGNKLWFSEGLCPVDAGLHTGFIDRDGRVAIDATFYTAEHFSCGRALAIEIEDGPEGFIDTSGRWVVKPRFEYAFAFNEGVAMVSDGYIDTEGNYIWKDSQ